MAAPARMSDAALDRRARELYVHLVECAIDPEHPVSKMNRARWEREAKQVANEIQRRRDNWADDGPEPDGYRPDGRACSR